MTKEKNNEDSLSGNTIIGVAVPIGMSIAPVENEGPPPPGVKELLMDRKEFKIRLADNEGQRSSANMLIKKMYSWRGYASAFSAEKQPNRITLVASSGNVTVATLTLLVDELYKEEIDHLRAVGRKLCEFTKLAVDSGIRSKQVLASIFHIAYIYAREIRGQTDLFIEVNPRHVRFYEKMLGFSQFGVEKTNTRVNAPAVLLRVELDYVKDQIDKYGGRPNMGEAVKSLYPYGFSPAETEGIANRLRSLR
jgi:hypothetical protein